MLIYRRVAVQTAFFVNGFVFANWVGRLPRIQETFGADNGTIGLVLLCSSVGAIGAMPFTGWAILRKGSRKITLYSALLYCLLVPLIPTLPGIGTLIALYFFMGISTGMLDVAMNAQAIMVEQAYGRSLMTSFHAFFSIGMMFGAGAASLFSDLGVDIFYHFSTIAGLSLVAIAWMGRNLIFDLPDPASAQDEVYFRLPSRSLIGIGAIAFCCMIGEGAVSDWSVNYMENIVASSKTIAPLGLSAFATAMTFGRLLGDRVRTSMGDRSMVVTGGALALLGLGTALVVPKEPFAIGGFFLVGIGLSTIVPITYSIAGNTPGTSSGVGIAMVTTVGYAGFLIGPPAIGFLAEWQGLRIALTLITALFALMTWLGALLIARANGTPSS